MKIRRIIKWGLGGLGVLALIIVVVAVATSGGKTTGNTNAANAAASALARENACNTSGGIWNATGDGSCISNTTTEPLPAPSPTVLPADKVEFVISGYAQADPGCGGIPSCAPDISYGSNSDTHQLNSNINGTVTYSMPFDPNAEFYSVNVNTTTAGSHLTCKIVVLGPSPDVPLTVAQGSETGSAICNAQAAPTDSTGESWSQES